MRVVLMLLAAVVGVAYGALAMREGWFPASVFGPAPASSSPVSPAGGAAPVLPDAASVDRSEQVRRAAGKWHRVPQWAQQRERQTPVDEAMSDSPYLRGVELAPELAGVTAYHPDAYHGVNLVLSGHGPEAMLCDMTGRELHRWRKPFEDVWPAELPFQEYPIHKTFWRRVHALPDGGLLAVFEGIGMIRLDADSNIVWAYQGRCHHDIAIRDDGAIVTLGHDSREVAGGTILDDFVLVLSPEGEELEKVSVLDAFLNSRYAGVLRPGAGVRDLFHTNAVVPLDDRFRRRIPAFRSGSVLLSMRNLDALAIIDLKKTRVTWAMTGMWGRQHQPSLLDNGLVLLFDNVGTGTHSKVIEFDPGTQQLAWVYTGSEASPFHSLHAGSCARLPNGNTMIVESLTGRAFEVTREKKIVWEYWNPAREGDEDDLIAVLYDVVRLDWDYFDAFPALREARARAEAAVDLEGAENLLEGRR